MKIAGMVVWMLTAGIGVYLLTAGIAAQRQAAGPGAGPGAGAGAGPDAGPADSALLEFIHPALALTGLTFWIFFVVTSGRVFAWIALGVVVAAMLAGASWVITGWRNARAAGRREPGQPGHGRWREPRLPSHGRGPGKPVEGQGFPAHLILVHGLAAACTLTLVVIAAVAARG